MWLCNGTRGYRKYGLKRCARLQRKKVTKRRGEIYSRCRILTQYVWGGGGGADSAPTPPPPPAFLGLNGLSKSAQTFTVGFLKLLSTLPIHIVVWGNFPFNPAPLTTIHPDILPKNHFQRTKDWLSFKRSAGLPEEYYHLCIAAKCKHSSVLLCMLHVPCRLHLKQWWL